MGNPLDHRRRRDGHASDHTLTGPSPCTVGPGSPPPPCSAPSLRQQPAANGVFDARSLARLFSTVVDGPLRVVSSASVDRVGHQQVHGPDEVLVDQPTRFGTVFGLSSPRQPMLGPGSFGHDGLGGHLAFAHPESGIAFAFLTNRAIPDPTPHTRLWRRLLSAVTAAL
ncbi:serine hydrolase [Streptomyces sp900105755]|uniref:Serine hydrolase n=1 Tax=Streptomyces sp. 900105755 TaxID=3154389 RepID=A0ABV1TVR4_9ACTN